MAGRADCVAVNPEIEKREGFPLKHGTWICCRKANHHTFKLGFKAVQTHDIVAFWPAERSWDSIVDEIQAAHGSLFGGE